MRLKENIYRSERDSTSIFEQRSVENDYRTLIPILKPGMRILDIGCGTGAMTRGLLKYLGAEGYVIGIDSEAAFIRSAQLKGQSFKNLDFIHQDLYSFKPSERFDLVIAARTLQWIQNPISAIEKIKQFIKPGGLLSVLDYNHLDIEWEPELPSAMQKVFEAFLNWRKESGLNNQISEDLPDYFREAGLTNIEVMEANETYMKNQPNFMSKLGIWDKVAALPQIVDSGYLDKETLNRALAVYRKWKQNDARRMVLKLKEIRGVLR